MIEAINLVPDFLEDLVSNNLLDALSGGEIRVEPLCQIALERSIPDVADVLTIRIVADFGGGFEQLRLYHRIATMDPKAPLPPLADQAPTWDRAAALARDWELGRLADRLDELAET